MQLQIDNNNSLEKYNTPYDTGNNTPPSWVRSPVGKLLAVKMFLFNETETSAPSPVHSAHIQTQTNPEDNDRVNMTTEKTFPRIITLD